MAGGALALGLLVGWLLFGSTALAVHRIEVHGVRRVSAADVRAQLATEVGRSMALVSPQDVAERVSRLPLVKAVTVVRTWPTTLVVTVTEREPIAAVPAVGGRVALVDPDGVVVDTAAAAPPGMPLLQVDVARNGAEVLRAARAVYDALPASLRSGVHQIKASTPDAISFLLPDGSTVIWGSAQDGARKADALLVVHPKPLPHPAVIDVSSPDTPAVTTPTR
jgi:cell division protein FtsQ